VIRSPKAAGEIPLPVPEKISPDALRAALAWQGPRLVFLDTPLAEVFAQFNRRNPVQIELADPELGSLPVGGSFSSDNLEAFVRLLANDSDILIEYQGTNRIVIRRAGARPPPE
jgi:transmembrane sensor